MIVEFPLYTDIKTTNILTERALFTLLDIEQQLCWRYNEYYLLSPFMVTFAKLVIH